MFHQCYGEKFQVECPMGSSSFMNLASVAGEFQHWLIHIFGKEAGGQRAMNTHGQAHPM